MLFRDLNKLPTKVTVQMFGFYCTQKGKNVGIIFKLRHLFEVRTVSRELFFFFEELIVLKFHCLQNQTFKCVQVFVAPLQPQKQIQKSHSPTSLESGFFSVNFE